MELEGPMAVTRCPYCRKILRPGTDEIVVLHLKQRGGLRVKISYHETCAMEDPLHMRLADKLNERNPNINEEYLAIRDRAASHGLQELMETVKVPGQHPHPSMTGRKKNLDYWGIAVLK